jgi:hypothetical protein
MSAKGVQVGGGHYRRFAIQPVEFIHRNGIPYVEGNIVKYVCRWRDKGGLQDLEKARHYIDLLIEMEVGDLSLSREPSPRVNAALNRIVEQQARRLYDPQDVHAR